MIVLLSLFIIEIVNLLYKEQVNLNPWDYKYIKMVPSLLYTFSYHDIRVNRFLIKYLLQVMALLHCMNVCVGM